MVSTGLLKLVGFMFWGFGVEFAGALEIVGDP